MRNLFARISFAPIALLLPGLALAQTPTNAAGALFTALQSNAPVVAACPALVGTSVGDPADPTTWSAQFASTPSGACNTAVSTVIFTMVLPTPLTTIQIASTGTPSLNGIYAIDPVSLQNISATTIYLSMNGVFPNGGSTISWPLATAGPALPTFNATNWMNFSKAVTTYVNQANANNAAFIPPPSQPVTIP